MRGWPGPVRRAEGLLAPALASPGDSTRLAGALGALVAALQADGWLDARAEGAWSGAPARLEVSVEPGAPRRWGTLSLDVPAADSAALAAALEWRAGEPVRTAALTRAIERAVTQAEREGYAWAQLGVSGWSEDSGRVDVRLSGSRGPLVKVSDVRLEGLRVTRPEVAERVMGRLRGTDYDPSRIALATQRLAQLGVFRRVDYAGLAGGGAYAQGVLRWRVEEPRYNTFEGAVGVQGDAGVAGLARLELGNLLGTARAVGLAWQSRGKGLADFSARYTEPMLFGRALRLSGEMRQQVQDTSWTRFRYGARLSAAIGERERIEAGFGEERVAQSRGTVQSADQQETSFALERDGRDDALAPRRGTRVRVSATQSFKRERLRGVAAGGAATRTARLSGADLAVEWHRALSRRSGLGLDATVAGRFTTQAELADWERFTLGGAATLRGHDEEAFRPDRYALTRFEYRWFLGAAGERVALFWDHALMETRGTASAPAANGTRRENADGLGFGLRLPAAGGHVELDYGLAPGNGVLEGKMHLRLVTAF
ncbi:MAG: BamA/TamA family outer membrane protein [Candidatus Eisenbacteria bacterium]|uniref:BamA/TamA family outer membrane protein n=1 Tax=Eiseniibacteriota bacterium TaxID=2212470 RepID=A0A933SCK5_UNCEI|nr:BamA/TamA family outer membrane protein [Candidatus Eisenbacteria bacterium]